MNYLIYDLVIVVILLLFALWGRHRGLILSVFSLLALVIAIVGGFFLSNLLTPTVSGWIQPSVEDTVVSVVQSALENETEGALPVFSPDENEVNTIHDYLTDAGIELPESLQTILTQPNEGDFSDSVISTSVENLAVSVAEKLVSSVVRIVLFLLAFVLILILWHVLARALDLVSRLPGLNALNKLGGFLFGAIRGALVLFVVAWLLKCYPGTINSLIPAEILEQTHLLKFFLAAKPLDFLALL